MRLAQRGALVAALPIEVGGQGRARGRADARAFGTLSALGLPAHSHLVRARRDADEPGTRASTVEECGASSPEETAPKAPCGLSAPTSPGHRTQSSLGLRLRVRCVRQRAEAQVPHRGRRVDARIARHRRRGESSLTACHRSARPARRRARSTPDAALGQRTGVRVARRARMAKPSRRPARLHRTRQALAERHQRELQWEVSRRVPQHGVVSQSCRSPRAH